MNVLSRVVWSEGMYLGPHHFQVQSRYFEDSIQFATSTLWFSSYGLAGVDLDAEALQNGTVSLLHARGIFRDGLTFHMPESDALPEPRAVADLFPPTHDGIVVLLAIPPRKPNGFNCSLPDGEIAEARYTAEPRVLRDENTGADERTVHLGRKNLRLLFDTEPAGDLLTMPIARVVRDGAGHFAYDANFVPPVLGISASTRLMLLAQRLIEILDDKSAAIGRGARNASGGPAEFSTRRDRQLLADACREFRLDAAASPVHRQARPSRRAVRRDVAPRRRPVHLRARFAPARPAAVRSRQPERLLRGTRPPHSRAPGNHRSHQLHFHSAETARSDYYYEGDIADQRCLGRSRWLLAIRARMGDADLMAKAPQLIKVCSPAFVRELVKRALPGMPLTHLPVPPPAVSARRGNAIFRSEQGRPLLGPHERRRAQVGVYVPGEFPDPEIEILVVLEQLTMTPSVEYPQAGKPAAHFPGSLHGHRTAALESPGRHRFAVLPPSHPRGAQDRRRPGAGRRLSRRRRQVRHLRHGRVPG